LLQWPTQERKLSYFFSRSSNQLLFQLYISSLEQSHIIWMVYNKEYNYYNDCIPLESHLNNNMLIDVYLTLRTTLNNYNTWFLKRFSTFKRYYHIYNNHSTNSKQLFHWRIYVIHISSNLTYFITSTYFTYKSNHYTFEMQY